MSNLPTARGRAWSRRKLVRSAAVAASADSPAKQFCAIRPAKRGIDIDKDVEWRVCPADLSDGAVRKGDIQAIADGDPNLCLIEKRNPGLFTEIGNSARGEYAERTCCVVGARGILKKSTDVVRFANHVSLDVLG